MSTKRNEFGERLAKIAKEKNMLLIIFYVYKRNVQLEEALQKYIRTMW